MSRTVYVMLDGKIVAKGDATPHAAAFWPDRADELETIAERIGIEDFKRLYLNEMPPRPPPLGRDKGRGTGRTTRQIIEAPQKAIFVSCHQHSVREDQRTACIYGRKDVRVEGPDWVELGYWRGIYDREIILDHAFFDVANRFAREHAREMIAYFHARRELARRPTP